MTYFSVFQSYEVFDRLHFSFFGSSQSLDAEQNQHQKQQQQQQRSICLQLRCTYVHGFQLLSNSSEHSIHVVLFILVFLQFII